MKITFKVSRNFRYALLLVPLVVLVLLALGYLSVTKEIEEKFFRPDNSIPTRVYSRPWILRNGAAFSLAEARSRLAERHYQEMSENSAPHAGFFAIASAAEGDTSVKIMLNDFSYPKPYVDFLLRQEGPDLRLGQGSLQINVQAGRIKQLTFSNNGNTEDVHSVAVEPVVVAQLNAANTEAREFIPLADIPHTLLKGIVNVEDQRFLEHLGIDPRGIVRSIWANLRAGAYVQGASTITQQLIRNVYLSNTKTLSRKVKEMAMAIVLEMRYSKDIILEKYLNEVYFGQTGNISVRGVGQAAKYYFAKPVNKLSIAEQALIAAIIRGPFYYSPYRNWDRAKQRQEFVLKRMLETNVISQNEFKAANKVKIKLAPATVAQDHAPYFTDLVKSQLGEELPDQAIIGNGYKVFSTVDTYYQKLADDAVAKGLTTLEATMKKTLEKRKKQDIDWKTLQGAMVVLDPHTNQILAMVGGRSFAESNYNRVLLMRRQVGSIFKPFVFLAALIFGKDEKGQPYNAISKLEDKPFQYEYDKQVWVPKNFEENFLGTVTFRFALAHSLNVPTARLATQLGIPYIIEVAKKAGVETEMQPYPSISLGTVELTPIEVARAYSTLVNLGVRKDTTAITMVLDEQNESIAQYESNEEQVLPLPETANIVDLMTTVLTDGTATPVTKAQGFSAAAAGKTGTTNEYRDAWFAGFTPDLLVVSWVGYDRDDEDAKKLRRSFKLTGAVAALPLWTQFMKSAIHSSTSPDFNFPSGTLRRLRVDLLSGKLAGGECSSGNNIVEETFTYNNSPHETCMTSH